MDRALYTKQRGSLMLTRRSLFLCSFPPTLSILLSILFISLSLCIDAVFTYRYFLHRFPQLCILAVNEADEPIGCVVGKIDEEDVSIPLVTTVGGGEEQHNNNSNGGAADDRHQHSPFETTTLVGYIGMLAVSAEYRRRGIGKALVQRILRRMRSTGCTSATLETEKTNVTAQRLYQNMFGFVREELLVRYYLNWNDAYRLRLWF